MHINLFMVVLNFGVYVNNLVNIFFEKRYIYIYIYMYYVYIYIYIYIYNFLKFLDIVNILLVYVQDRHVFITSIFN